MTTISKVIKYNRGGVTLGSEEGIAYRIPLGVSSNGYAIRIHGGKLYAYVCNDRGLPMKEASDGDDLGEVNYIEVEK